MRNQAPIRFKKKMKYQKTRKTQKKEKMSKWRFGHEVRELCVCGLFV